MATMTAAKTASIKIKLSSGDRIFNIVNYTVLSILLLVVLYPLYFVLIASFSDPNLVNQGKVLFFPQGITWEGYKGVFKDKSIMQGYMNTIVYTVVGVLVSVGITVPMAYALSRKDMKGRNVVMVLVIFTMFFSGGLIPTYLLINDLNMVNTMWALVLPSAVVPFNLIICRTFFESTIPLELREAALLDGCDDFQFLFRMVLPVSGAVIAIMVLFYGVAKWNTYFDALIYLKDSSKYPLQLVLRNILILNQVSPDMLGDVQQAALRQQRAELIKYVAIIVSSLPLLVLYPFLQKYFVKGVMIGAVKG